MPHAALPHRIVGGWVGNGMNANQACPDVTAERKFRKGWEDLKRRRISTKDPSVSSRGGWRRKTPPKTSSYGRAAHALSPTDRGSVAWRIRKTSPAQGAIIGFPSPLRTERAEGLSLYNRRALKKNKQKRACSKADTDADAHPTTLAGLSF